MFLNKWSVSKLTTNKEIKIINDELVLSGIGIPCDINYCSICGYWHWLPSNHQCSLLVNSYSL